MTTMVYPTITQPVPPAHWRVLPLGPDDRRLSASTQDRLGPQVGETAPDLPLTTRGFAPEPGTIPARADPEHLRRVRDRIVILSGLSRQAIAAALGVDRRSVSGWMTGEIRPNEEHLRRLERLIQLVVEVEAAHPTQSGTILKTVTVGGNTLLDLLAQGRYLEIRAWRLLTAGAPGLPQGSFGVKMENGPPKRLPISDVIRDSALARSPERLPRGPRPLGEPFSLSVMERSSRHR